MRDVETYNLKSRYILFLNISIQANLVKYCIDKVLNMLNLILILCLNTFL